MSEDADAVSRFVAATSDHSLRQAAALIGVSHTAVGNLRKWAEGGANPEELSVKPATLRAVRDYLEMHAEIKARRMALRVAAQVLEELAGELRDEAVSPRASGALDAQALVSRALREEREDDPSRPEPTS